MKNCAWARGRCEVKSMRNENKSPAKPESGQSLVETVLILPLLLFVLLNAVNFGYFFLTLVNITAAPRSGVEYSVMGSATPAATALPATGPATCASATDPGCLSVSYLTYRDLTGALSDPTTNGAIQVCSQSKGLNNPGTTTETTKCDRFGTVPVGYTWHTPDTDPELNSGNTAPAFALNRVDVVYQYTPIIPASPLNIALLAIPACTSTGGNVKCTFTRSTQMRVM